MGSPRGTLRCPGMGDSVRLVVAGLAGPRESVPLAIAMPDAMANAMAKTVAKGADGLGKTAARWCSAACIPKGIFQQKCTEIGYRPAFFFRAIQEGLMHVIAQGDGDATGLPLQYA